MKEPSRIVSVSISTSVLGSRKGGGGLGLSHAKPKLSLHPKGVRV